MVGGELTSGLVWKKWNERHRLGRERSLSVMVMKNVWDQWENEAGVI